MFESETSTIERGTIAFHYRPRAEPESPAEFAVDRLLMLLSPEGGVHERLIAVGRPRNPRGNHRFWGFVDLVLDAFDMQAALGAQVYASKRTEMRHLPAAREAGRGTYEIAWHRDHAHLSWELEELGSADRFAGGPAIDPHGDCIVTVANPDLAAWGVDVAPDLQSELFDTLEVHVTLPAPFSPDLQRRFRGHRFAQLDSVAWLDHPGTELVFLHSSERRQARLSVM